MSSTDLPATPNWSLEIIGVGEGHIRNAVGNDIHLGIRHPVDLAQDFRALVRHHHQAVAAPHQFVHHMALRRIRFVQHGVQRGDHRHPHLLEQGQQVAAGRTAVDAELVLHAEHVRVVLVQFIRGGPIGISSPSGRFQSAPRADNRSLPGGR